jgi:hypothetical protein
VERSRMPRVKGSPKKFVKTGAQANANTWVFLMKGKPTSSLFFVPLSHPPYTLHFTLAGESSTSCTSLFPFTATSPRAATYYWPLFTFRRSINARGRPLTRHSLLLLLLLLRRRRTFIALIALIAHNSYSSRCFLSPLRPLSPLLRDDGIRGSDRDTLARF